MSTSRKKYLTAFAASIFTIGSLGMLNQAEAKTYNATFYVAGMGGHFAKAETVIDPSNTKPITVKNLTKVDIGTRATHPVHDARIDVNDRNTMFWSTYQADKSDALKDKNVTHVGKTDLKTGEVTLDVQVDIPSEASKDKSLYCASAQSKDSFIPISMANKGYIDVFNKSDLARTQRVFLEGTEADIGKPYKFYHGTNSNDMSRMVLAINESDVPHGTTVGKLHVITVDLNEFVKGNVKVINKAVLPGAEKKTVSFRQYYSNDDKMIANATGDRLFVLDANTLEVIDSEMLSGIEETHDAIFTPDDKYIVITSRYKNALANCEDPQKPKDGEFVMDGHLRLYDVEAKKFIGESTSVCLTCHDKEGLTEHAVLCGLDANWQ